MFGVIVTRTVLVTLRKEVKLRRNLKYSEIVK